MTTIVKKALWKANAEPIAWRGDRVFYNAKNATGRFDGWSAKSDGTDAKKITTSPSYATGTQHGLSDVSPDGKYVLATVERKSGFLLPIIVSAPGNGALNNLWIQTADGKQAWLLRDLVVQNTNALIWARFNADGSKIAWTEQWLYGQPFGGWVLYVADLIWKDGVPSLEVTASLKSDGLIEAYGWQDDGRIIFAADALAGTTWANLQVMTVSESLNDPKPITPTDKPTTVAWQNSNEFAYQIPGAQRILLTRTAGDSPNGPNWLSSELWTMAMDGSDPRQLSRFSWLDDKWFGGWPSFAGPMTFDPANPLRFLACFDSDFTLSFKTWLVTVDKWA